jgi:hypothetical protein
VIDGCWLIWLYVGRSCSSVGLAVCCLCGIRWSCTLVGWVVRSVWCSCQLSVVEGI